jgi:hypothetical protein
MVKILQQLLRWLFMRIENVFNVAFGDKMNPFYHLGTISFWQFWLLVAPASTSTSSPIPASTTLSSRSSGSPTTSGGRAASCAASTATRLTA